MEAFASFGYKPEHVTKILLIHKREDNSGELRFFSDSKIYVDKDETSEDKLQCIPNLMLVAFTGGAYYSFPESQKIQDGITFIKAKEHIDRNSITVVEFDGQFYMIYVDITYVDKTLYENKLSVIFDDLQVARKTMDQVSEFVCNHSNVYCGIHTPQRYENLDNKRVMDLNNPVQTILAEVDFTLTKASGKYVCYICGCVHDPDEHDNVVFEDFPDGWEYP